jgi:tricorn protease
MPRKDKKDEKKDEKKEEKPAELKIDFDGIEQRVARVPLEAQNYANLFAKKGYLIYTVYGPAITAARARPSLRCGSTR